MTERRSLLDVFTPVMLDVLDVEDGLARGDGSVPSAEQKTEEWLATIDEAVATAERLGHSSQNAEIAKRAVIAWIDDIMGLRRDWYGRVTNLQSRVYNGASVLGRKFYEDLEALSKDSQRDVFDVFFVCLALGFKGEKLLYAGPDVDREAARIKQDVSFHLSTDRIDLDRLPGQKIFAQPYQQDDPPPPLPGPPLPRSYGKILAALAAVLLLAAIGAGYWLTRSETDWRAHIQAAAEEAVGRYECASVSVRTAPDLSLSYKGFVGSEDDRGGLEADLLGIERVERVTGTLEVMPWPLCAVLVILEDTVLNDGSRSETPTVAVNHRDGRYRHRDLLVTDVTVPAAEPGHLLVSYVGQADTVTHLFPNEDVVSSRADPKMRLRLGYAEGAASDAGGYDVQTNLMYPLSADPEGPSLVFAVWSAEPILDGFAPVSQQRTDEFLAALRAAVDASNASDDAARLYARTVTITVAR